MMAPTLPLPVSATTASALPTSALPKNTNMCISPSSTTETRPQRYARSLRNYLHNLKGHKQIWDGVVATVIVLIAQLIIAAIDLMLDNHSVDFPPSILAMVAVFVVLSAMGCVVPRLEEFYQNHLSRAVS